MSWVYHIAADAWRDLQQLSAEVQEVVIDELEELVERADGGETWMLRPRTIRPIVQGELVPLTLELQANAGNGVLTLLGVTSL